MTLITPAGKRDFDWSPVDKSEMVKTASTGSAPKTDKDILFEAAQKFVKAQIVLDETNVTDEKTNEPCADGLPCKEEAPCVDGLPCGDKSEGTVTETSFPAADEKPAEGKSDAVKAVQELADKANKAEEVAGKVQEAVEKVEEAVQGVKDAVGAEVANVEGVEEVEIEIEDEKEEKDEKGEKDEKPEKKEKGEKDEKPDEKEEKDEGEKDDIIKESIEACASAKDALKTASSEEFVKLSKISPTTRKKITTFYKDYLGYDPAYVKLMVTDYEK